MIGKFGRNFFIKYISDISFLNSESKKILVNFLRAKCKWFRIIEHGLMVSKAFCKMENYESRLFLAHRESSLLNFTFPEDFVEIVESYALKCFMNIFERAFLINIA